MTDGERLQRLSCVLSIALDLVDSALDRLEREELDTTTERELLARLWWDGMALAKGTKLEEENV